MKQLGILQFPPGWDDSPSQGYRPAVWRQYKFIHVGGEKGCGQGILSWETTRWQGVGVEPPTFRSEVQRTNHYTTAPPTNNSQW